MDVLGHVCTRSSLLKMKMLLRLLECVLVSQGDCIFRCMGETPLFESLLSCIKVLGGPPSLSLSYRVMVLLLGGV